MRDLDRVLDGAKQLYDIGCAMLLIREGEKRPLNSGWTTGERTPWREIEKSYKPGMNIGVRTGEASKIGENYLAVIDIDIKDSAFLERALVKIKEMIGDAKCPQVASGSGGLSHHLYCVTKEPFKMFMALKEPGLGEVAVYSTGRQMVVPPSRTKKYYKWTVPIKGIDDLPLIDFSPFMKTAEKSSKTDHSIDTVSRTAAKLEADWDFNPTIVDLDWLPISNEVREAIVSGKDVSDRSSYLLKASRALLSAGCTEMDILTVLTDKDYYLGNCAYDHAQTSNRNAAARWLAKYTVRGVVESRSVDGIFSSVPVDESGEITFDELVAQSEELKKTAQPLYDGEAEGYRMGKKGIAYGELLKKFNSDMPFKTISDMKSVYVFNGTHYEYFSPIEVKAYAEQKIKPDPKETERHEFLNKVLANNVANRQFFMRATEGRINFKNGILNLKNPNELLPHSPKYGFRGVLPFDFDPEAKCAQFDEWLNNVMLGDEALKKTLQEYMGYIVRGGEYRFHKALWLEGVGRNGKSTFIDLLKALVGLGNYSVISIRALVGDKFAGADLDGKIANFSEETSPQELSDSGPFKNLTGDGDIMAQKKFGEPFHFRNRAKLVMSYNQIPDIKDLSPGMMSRPIIIPFEKIISEEEQDRDIKQKLIEELPGIFNFALKGWYRLEKQNHFTPNKRSIAALTKIKEESCNVHQFIENYIEFVESTEEKDHWIRSEDLYKQYKKQEHYAYKSIEFFRRLKKHRKMDERHSRVASIWGYKNIRVRDANTVTRYIQKEGEKDTF